MSDYGKTLGWRREPGGGAPRKMSFRGAFVAFAVPVLVQAACLVYLKSIDPCNNNPGCMAGSATFYAMLFVSAPSVVILLVLTLIEWATRRIGVRTALTINVVLAVLPFAWIIAQLT